MATAVICCKMIENELKSALEGFKCDTPIIWLDAGLHNFPEKLNHSLQEELDKLQKDVSRVILGYGLCGKAVIGLKTGNYELIMPKVDDCIAFLLGSNKAKIDNKATYFITENWIKDAKSIFSEYDYAINKYGPVKCERIFKRQFANYNTLGIIDTGCFSVNSVLKKTEEVREILNLSPKVIPTDCSLLSDLFSNKVYDNENFLIIPANSEITEKLFFDFMD